MSQNDAENDVIPGASGAGEGEMTQEQIDIIGEVCNISMGSAATALSNLIGAKVVITSPEVKVGSKAVIEKIERIPSIGVTISYTEGVVGQSILIIRKSDANEIVKVLMGGEMPESEEFGELQLSAIGEVMNQMMGSSATALSGFIGKSVNISPPSAFVLTDENKFEKLKFIYDKVDSIVFVKFLFHVENMFDSDIYMIMPQDFAGELVDAMLTIMGGGQPEPAAQPAASAAPAQPAAAQQPVSGNIYQTPPAQQAPAHEAPPAQQAPAYEAPPAREAPTYEAPPAAETRQKAAAAYARPVVQTTVRPAILPDLEPSDQMSADEATNFELIQEVPLELSVEVGRARKLVKEVIDFSVGSIIELDKQAGDPVDIIVNGQLIAHGEVVVIDESFGVRVTEIVNKNARNR